MVTKVSKYQIQYRSKRNNDNKRNHRKETIYNMVSLPQSQLQTQSWREIIKNTTIKMYSFKKVNFIMFFDLLLQVDLNLITSMKPVFTPSYIFPNELALALQLENQISTQARTQDGLVLIQYIS